MLLLSRAAQTFPNELQDAAHMADNDPEKNLFVLLSHAQAGIQAQGLLRLAEMIESGAFTSQRFLTGYLTPLISHYILRSMEFADPTRSARAAVAASSAKQCLSNAMTALTKLANHLPWHVYVRLLMVRSPIPVRFTCPFLWMLMFA